MADFDKDNDELFPELAEEAQQAYDSLQYWGQRTEMKITNSAIRTIIPSIQFPIKLNDFYKAIKDTPAYNPFKIELAKQIQEHKGRWWPVRLWRYFFSDITSRQKLHEYIIAIDSLWHLKECFPMFRLEFEVITGMPKKQEKKSILRMAFSTQASRLTGQKGKLQHIQNEAFSACKDLEKEYDKVGIEKTDLQQKIDVILQSYQQQCQPIIDEFSDIKSQLQKVYQKIFARLQQRTQELFAKLTTKSQASVLQVVLKPSSNKLPQKITTIQNEQQTDDDASIKALLIDIRKTLSEAKSESDFETKRLAAKESIVKFFKKIVLRHHPDKRGSAELFIKYKDQIDNAKSVLDGFTYKSFAYSVKFLDDLIGDTPQDDKNLTPEQWFNSLDERLNSLKQKFAQIRMVQDQLFEDFRQIKEDNIKIKEDNIKIKEDSIKIKEDSIQRQKEYQEIAKDYQKIGQTYRDMTAKLTEAHANLDVFCEGILQEASQANQKLKERMNQMIDQILDEELGIIVLYDNLASIQGDISLQAAEILIEKGIFAYVRDMLDLYNNECEEEYIQLWAQRLLLHLDQAEKVLTNPINNNNNNHTDFTASVISEDTAPKNGL